MVVRIFLSLGIGFFLTLFVMQQDPWVKDVVCKQIKNGFSESFPCNVDCCVVHVNFFHPAVVLEDVNVQSRDGQVWSWSSKRFITTISWLQLVLYGVIELHVAMEDMHAQSELINGNLAIVSHIKLFFTQMDVAIPIMLKSLTFRRAHLEVIDREKQMLASINMHSELKLLDSVVKSRCHVHDGSLCIGDSYCFEQLHGIIDFDVPTKQNNALHIKADCSLHVPSLDKNCQLCFVTANICGSQGQLSIKNADKTFTVDSTLLRAADGKYNTECHASFPLVFFRSWIDRNNRYINLNGNCSVDVLFDGSDNIIYGKGVLENISYNQTEIHSAGRVTFERKQNIWNGSIHVENSGSEIIKGVWNWNEIDSGGNYSVSNCSTCLVPTKKEWYIKPHNLTIKGSFDSSSGFKSFYQVKADHEKIQDTVALDGTFSMHNKLCSVHGYCNKNYYSCDWSFKPFRITKIRYEDENHQPLLSVDARSHDSTKLEGTILFPFVRSLVRDGTGYDMQGEGSFKVYVHVKDDTPIIKLCLVEGSTIRLPQTYNFIRHFDCICTGNIEQRKIIIKNARCGFHKGDLSCRRATFLFDNDGGLTFAHVPIIVEHCLFNSKKDLFSLVSGDIVLTHNTISSYLSGTLFLERTHLNENIFSGALQKTIFHIGKLLGDVQQSTIMCDLSCSTHSPIHIRTSLLEIDAVGRIAIKGLIDNPELVGSIELLSGTVFFPYKPLCITKGSLYFVPSQPFNPVIELVAKNKIKKYNIALSVTGSLSHHCVMLKSVPPLTEEQIIGLLLIGSHEDSLSSMVPALIVQNLKKVVFDSDQAFITLNRYMKRFFRPFKYITVVPSFSDQTGRGGLRGAVEIDSGDRWRALIQKNFSLSEDIRVEFEYFLSDDMSVKAIRDERRDISGEMEMRWKF